MLIVELSVVPVGTGSTGVSQYVRAALRIIKKNGLTYEVNPMGTCIEGDWDEIFATVKEIHETLAQAGCRRIVTTIKIDDRRDSYQTMKTKLLKVTGQHSNNSISDNPHPDQL